MTDELKQKLIMVARFMVKDVPGELAVLEYDLKKAGTVESMQYHKSWEWLMPVVEKIENCFDAAVIVIIDGDNCRIQYGNKYKISGAGHTKFEAVFNATEDFIDWYNKH